MDAYTGAHTSQQTPFDQEQERQIESQVEILAQKIGTNLFTRNVIQLIDSFLYAPSSSTRIQNEAFERYRRSLSGGDRHRLSNELEIFCFTGHASTFFVRGQELDSFAADELTLVVKGWIEGTQKMYCPPYGDKETIALTLLRKFGDYQVERGFVRWTQMHLKALRSYCASSTPGFKKPAGKSQTC